MIVAVIHIGGINGDIFAQSYTGLDDG
jgi:hypothetical protein